MEEIIKDLWSQTIFPPKPMVLAAIKAAGFTGALAADVSKKVKVNFEIYY